MTADAAPETAAGIGAFAVQESVLGSYTWSTASVPVLPLPPATYSRPLMVPEADSARAVGIGVLVVHCPLIPACAGIPLAETVSVRRAVRTIRMARLLV